MAASIATMFKEKYNSISNSTRNKVTLGTLLQFNPAKYSVQRFFFVFWMTWRKGIKMV
ncbi:hypothetical protein HanRHA438_Chr03g0119781 [Helianthus annuus]|uniref:Uncharacterized protein n=1 Tax=Helianthus annuus TaxID=4232 RepID=A0A251TJ49_HELAN|nr:hypothetical protein HanXRQr2_Chr03g0108981 [Helianthus annuus]KAJ0607909.1 hypothetical protein HanHA89_Chr03g0102731 [Helianthus annuus]KAJ0773745.1 hypothetical protein HanOQP8_Chr03g0103801 [Helianthus annuus]KAJ0935456.1 hypothetical protein HanRHA438_Chr03g0119781 [Helianthus annuus]KAJ0943507.1 hypothetical protein HanPSC8_Chr03g0105551 [Helianthus annuus]